jgi:aryl sulfotransferase
MSALPEVKRHYLNHHLDSSRWEVYTPRSDDMIITTSYKCGTTFTQQILYNLLVENTADADVFPNLMSVSPWVDARFFPVTKKDLGRFLDAISHRRFLKSHLPLDGLPYFPEVSYLIVARDPRDVFMSLLNHYGAYTDTMYMMLNDGVDRPIPRYDGDDHTLWQKWLTQGWFEWEQEGYPFWSNMCHTQSFWNFRHLPNFLFLHYQDMKSDLPGTVRRIAAFIDHPVDDRQVADVVRAVSFDKVKAQAVAESSREEGIAFKGGQATFINKGTNERWKDFLTEAELELYRQTRDRVLIPDCAAWLEAGGEIPLP